MAESPIAANVRQTLDVRLDFSPQGALHFIVARNDRANFCHFIIAERPNFLIGVDTGLRENLICAAASDAENIAEPDFCSFILW